MSRSLVNVPLGPGRSMVKVRLPKGRRNLDSGLRSKLEDLAATKRLSNSGKCTVVFFNNGRTAVQRCENRKLKAHNKSQCRAKAKKGTKSYKRFVRCR